jgi:delta 1-pyrroline-5-carboxylate dehydrogenase
VEHAVHALDLEDRAGARRRLHGGAQAGGMVAGHGRSAGELVKQAGVPDGVLNTVHGIGEEAGKALTEHPAIKAIGFVGESATGSAIMAQGAPT